ncbi:hypothetical protein BX616_003689 [Lobosporangium transversale]|nr:hypothetical protein BX616_003689 [Lobosporangium transversale]
MQLLSHNVRTATKATISILVLILALNLLTPTTTAAPGYPLALSSFETKLYRKHVLFALEKRAPQDGGVPGAVLTTGEPAPAPSPSPEPQPTSPATTDPPSPPTTTPPTEKTTPAPSPPVTTKPTEKTTSIDEEEPSSLTDSPSEPTEGSSRDSKPSRSSGRSSKPTGSSSLPSVSNSSKAGTSPTATSTNPDDTSSGPSVLPIVLGSVLGLAVLITAGVFFFFRFRKHRRFDSKRPLSFLALSLEDPVGGSESASSRAAGTDAIFASNRPNTSQSSLRYTPPIMPGLMGSNRYSYQSEHSGATGAQYAQWSQDDENAALVGGPSRQQQLMMVESGDSRGGIYSDNNGFQRQRPSSQQSFVATSMVQLGPNDPLHARYSRQQSQDALENATSRHLDVSQHGSSGENVSLRTLDAEHTVPGESRLFPQRPTSIHSQGVSALSIRNPSPTPDQLESQASTHSAQNASKDIGTTPVGAPQQIVSNEEKEDGL